MISGTHRRRRTKHASKDVDAEYTLNTLTQIHRYERGLYTM